MQGSTAVDLDLSKEQILSVMEEYEQSDRRGVGGECGGGSFEEDEEEDEYEEEESASYGDTLQESDDAKAVQDGLNEVAMNKTAVPFGCSGSSGSDSDFSIALPGQAMDELNFAPTKFVDIKDQVGAHTHLNKRVFRSLSHYYGTWNKKENQPVLKPNQSMYHYVGVDYADPPLVAFAFTKSRNWWGMEELGLHYTEKQVAIKKPSRKKSGGNEVEEAAEQTFTTVVEMKELKRHNNDNRRPSTGVAAPPKAHGRGPSTSVASWRGMWSWSRLGGVPAKAKAYAAPTFGFRLKTYRELWSDVKARAKAVRALSASSNGVEISAAAIQYRMAGFAEVVEALFISMKFYVSDITGARTPKLQQFWGGVAKSVCDSMGATSGGGGVPGRYLVVSKPMTEEAKGGLLGQGGALARSCLGHFSLKKGRSPALLVLKALQDTEDAVYEELLKLPPWKDIKESIKKFDRNDWPVNVDRPDVEVGDSRSYDRAPEIGLKVSLKDNGVYDKYLEAVEHLLQSFTPEDTAAHEGGASPSYMDLLKVAKSQLGPKAGLQRLHYTGEDALNVDRVEIWPRVEDMYESGSGEERPACGLPVDATRLDDICTGITGEIVSDKATRSIWKKCKLNDAAALGEEAVMKSTDQVFFDNIVCKPGRMNLVETWKGKNHSYIPVFKALWGAMYNGCDLNQFSRKLTTTMELCDDLTETERYVALWDALTLYHTKCLETHISAPRAGSASVDLSVSEYPAEIKRMKQTALIERFARETLALYDLDHNRSIIHAQLAAKVKSIFSYEPRRVLNIASNMHRLDGRDQLSLEQERMAIYAAEGDTMQNITNIVSTFVAEQRDRAVTVSKLAVYDCIDDNVMKRVFDKALVEHKDNLTSLWMSITKTTQHVTDERHERKGVGEDEEEEKNRDMVLALQKLETKYGTASRASAAVYINHYQYVVEMLGPVGVPDWPALLINLAAQIQTSNVRWGDKVASTADNMNFQVFPLDPELEISRYFDGVPKDAPEDSVEDERMVIRSVVQEVDDKAYWALVLSSCAMSDETANLRTMALHSRGLMKLLEQGYAPATGAKKGGPLAHSFAHFWKRCEMGDLGETGRQLHSKWIRNKQTANVWGPVGVPQLDRLPGDRIWINQRIRSARNKMRSRQTSEVGAIAADAGKLPRFNNRSEVQGNVYDKPDVKRQATVDRRHKVMDYEAASRLRDQDEREQADTYRFILEKNARKAAMQLNDLGASEDAAAQREQIKRDAQLASDASEQQVRMLASTLSELLEKKAGGRGLFRNDRTVYKPGEMDDQGVGNGEYSTLQLLRDPHIEPIMTAQESLCAFQLVEMLTTIYAQCPGIFNATTSRSMDKCQFEAHLRMGRAVAWFDQTYGSKRRVMRLKLVGGGGGDTAGGSTDDFSILSNYLEGTWNIARLKNMYPLYYDELLKSVYRVLWQLKEPGYLEQRELFYPGLGTKEEREMLGIDVKPPPDFEQHRSERAVDLNERTTAVDMPYAPIAERIAVTEQGRLRRIVQFVEIMTEIHEKQVFDQEPSNELPNPEVAATATYLIEQIDKYLIMNNSLDVLMHGMNTDRFKTEAQSDILDNEENRLNCIRDIKLDDLAFGLPSEQEHPIGYPVFVMLTEIRSDLERQRDTIRRYSKEYKEEKRPEERKKLQVREIPAVRGLDRKRVNQPFYSNFMRMAVLLTGSIGGSSKKTFMRPRPPSDAGRRLEQIRVEAADNLEEDALLRPTDADKKDVILTHNEQENPELTHDVIMRRRNLDKDSDNQFVGNVEFDLAKQFTDPMFASMYQRHSMAVRQANDTVIMSSEGLQTDIFADPSAIGAVDQRERAAYTIERPTSHRPGGKGLHLDVLRFDLVTHTYTKKQLPYEKPTSSLPNIPDLKHVVETVQGAPPASDAEKYPHTAFYAFNKDPLMLYVAPLVKDVGFSELSDPNYATTRGPYVYPPKGPSAVENAARAEQRRVQEERNDKTRGRRVDRDNTLQNILDAKLVQSKEAEIRSKEQEAEKDARAVDAVDQLESWFSDASALRVDALREERIEKAIRRKQERGGEQKASPKRAKRETSDEARDDTHVVPMDLTAQETVMGDEDSDEERREERETPALRARPRVPFELIGLNVRFDEKNNMWLGPPGSTRGANGVWTVSAETRMQHTL